MILTPLYRAREATSDSDLAASLALRGRVFRKGGVLGDRDTFDARCRHVLIEETASGRLVGSFRLLILRDGRDLAGSYAAQHYELAALARLSGPFAEIGRFCLNPDLDDPMLLRMALAALFRELDRERIAFAFGAASFKGADATRHAAALSLLAQEHLAPLVWRPQGANPLPCHSLADRRAARAGLPPLLRGYLRLGAQVADSYVLDNDLDTLHIFTGIALASIPERQISALRLASGD